MKKYVCKGAIEARQVSNKPAVIQTSGDELGGLVISGEVSGEFLGEGVRLTGTTTTTQSSVGKISAD